jgi:hypothetical protein
VYPDRDSITHVAIVIATSQVALPENICQTVYAEEGYEASVSNLANVSLSSDGVFDDDGGASQLVTVTGGVEKGYAVSLNVGVDTGTTPGQSGGMGPGGGPGGGPPASRWSSAVRKLGGRAAVSLPGLRERRVSSLTRRCPQRQSSGGAKTSRSSRDGTK